MDSHLQNSLETKSELDAAVRTLELVAEDFEGSPLHGRIEPFCEHAPFCVVLAQDDDLGRVEVFSLGEFSMFTPSL